MNSFENPLVPVHDAFSIASDCFGLAARTLRIEHESLRISQFDEVKTEDSIIAFESAERQVADLTILALFATFERFVIQHLQAANRLLAEGHPQHYSCRLAEKFANEVEYWRFTEVLDLFKGEVDDALIGQVKQIKRYRDWIAHRNPNRRISVQPMPKAAFDILTKTIEQIQLTHMLPSEKERVEIAAPAL